MKKLFFSALLFFACVTLFTQCNWLFDITMEPAGMELLTFDNRSDQRLWIIACGEEYPDTLYPFGHGGGNEYSPHEKSSIWLNYGIDEFPSRLDYLAKYPIIQVFVVDHETRMTFSTDTIRARNLVLRRYELTREWLEEHDWTVVYP